MTSFDDDKSRNGISRLEGRPTEPEKNEERTLWDRFIAIFPTWFEGRVKKADELVERAGEGRTKKEEGEGDKAVNEATKIAAEEEGQKIDNVCKLNQEIERIFQSDAPLPAKNMQMANLVRQFPELIEQIDEIQADIQKLYYAHGFQFGIEARPPKAIAMDKDAFIDGTASYDLANDTLHAISKTLNRLSEIVSEVERDVITPINRISSHQILFLARRRLGEAEQDAKIAEKTLQNYLQVLSGSMGDIKELSDFDRARTIKQVDDLIEKAEEIIIIAKTNYDTITIAMQTLEDTPT